MEPQRQRLSLVEIVIVVLIAGVAATFVLPLHRAGHDMDAVARQLTAYRRAMDAQLATRGGYLRGNACAVDASRYGAPGDWHLTCVALADGYRAEIVGDDGQLLAVADVIVRDAPRNAAGEAAALRGRSAFASWVTGAVAPASESRPR